MSWSSWTPSAEQPWDLRRISHLWRRAGFAPTWGTIQTSLQAGVHESIDRVFNPNQEAVAPFEELATTIGEAAVGADSSDRLRAWWIYRMMMTPYPLQERMTLLWHNHFATSNEKVQDVHAMYEQNNLLRKHGLGKFGVLLPAVVKHRAMLSWLDASANRKEHPNENLARELMELFTLGEGNFTESDVPAAARCLTGWTIRANRFQFVPELHDSVEKRVLGYQANMDGDALLDLLLHQSATAKRLAGRLCGMFFGEDVVSQQNIDELAIGIRKHDLDLSWAVRKILGSELFFSEQNIRTRVACPAEYIIGAIRCLEMQSRPPSTLILAEQFRQQGQDLFYPPNVFGWQEGRAWISTRSIISRERFARELMDGAIHQVESPWNATQLASCYENSLSGRPIVDFLAELITGRSEVQKQFSVTAGVGDKERDQLRSSVARMLAHPASQLV